MAGFLKFKKLLAVLLATSVLPLLRAQDITLRSSATVVLVPTLVTDRNGDSIHGLTARDFIVHDNGQEQKIKIDETYESAPIALVLVVDRSRNAGPALDKVRRLGSLLEPLVGEGRGEVAVVAFDSAPQLVADFSSDTANVNAALKQLKPGDHGEAILDALRYAAQVLDKYAKTQRKVLLLASNEKDDGSTTTVESVIRIVEASNTQIYSVGFSSILSGLKTDPVNGAVGVGSINLTSIFSSIAKATRENVAQSVAQLSGGEYYSFGNEAELEKGLGNISNHFFNQYLLSFQPSKVQSGQHSLRVQLREPSGAIIYSRSGYFVMDNPEPKTE